MNRNNTHLFEHLAVRPLILLSLDLNRLIPAPLVLQELLVFCLCRVKLGELVALIVWSHIKGRVSFIATDEEGALDDRIVADTVDRGSPKEILAGCFETIEETA